MLRFGDSYAVLHPLRLRKLPPLYCGSSGALEYPTKRSVSSEVIAQQEAHERSAESTAGSPASRSHPRHRVRMASAAAVLLPGVVVDAAPPPAALSLCLR